MRGKIVFDTPFFSIEELPPVDTGAGRPYYLLNSPDAVICCLLSSTGEFLLVKQYRPSLNMHTLEFPAGAIEQDESPNEAAKREIREEIGVNCRLIYLGYHFLMMNRANEKNHLFICLQSDDGKEFATELGLELQRVPREEFNSLVSDGHFRQLAGLGILQVASMRLKIDVMQATLESIRSAFDEYADCE
jgi:8-oxo-dGTP pyrophosphatase MutT (NUDIX family)